MKWPAWTQSLGVDQCRRFEALENRHLLAAVPELLIDLGSPDEGALDYSDVEFAKVEDQLFFVADDRVHGRELWLSDGTTEGTRLVRDIGPNINGSHPYTVEQLTNVNGTLFFVASDGLENDRLWKSDGTESGTVAVGGVEARFLPGGLSNLVNVNGVLYFASSTSPDSELWRSDGTEAGTYLVKDVNPNGGSEPTHLTNVNGTLFFLAHGADGLGLWKSDGTQAGTLLVMDLPREVAGTTDANFLTAVGDLLYFVADDGTSGRELWRSDGTPDGTFLVSDILPGMQSSLPEQLTAVGDQLFFTAIGAGVGRELWRTDGTPEGTQLVMDTAPGIASADYNGLREYKGKLTYTTSDGVHGFPVWVSDGTPAGTTMLWDETLPTLEVRGALANLDGILYFQADDGTHGSELWRTDGTVQGTRLVADIWPGQDQSRPQLMAALGSELLFAADDGTTQRELWRTDGTTIGTVLVKEIDTTNPYDGYAGKFTDVNGQAFFVADSDRIGRELWVSDGTRDGTTLVRDIQPGFGSSRPDFLTNVGGVLFFRANDGTHGNELWRSDGTLEGTVLIKDLRADGSSDPQYLTNVDGTLYFSANDGVHGVELWKSDGTADGTVMVTDLQLGSSGSSPTNLLNAGGVLYFVANDGSHGLELWKSDGTDAGTTLVKDINPHGAADVANLTYENETLYFVANDGEHGNELWRSDGTEQGTALVADITAGGADSDSELFDFTNVNGVLYFALKLANWNRVLWETDGTASGTRPFVAGDSYDGPAVNFNGALVFGKSGGIWRSDGTASGTLQLDEYAQPEEMIVANDSVYFLSGDGVWQSDGTVVGTVLLSKRSPAAYHFDAYPHGLANVGGTLFYSTRDPVYGADPWIVPRDPSPAVLATHLFYNNSYFDGYTSGPSRQDDGAIATDKQAYQVPDTSDMENVTSYVRGINGLMFDVVGMANAPRLADFRFEWSEAGSATTVPRTFRWSSAPEPTSLTVRTGEGLFGSDRMTLIWPDGAIVDRWLRVIVAGNDLVGGHNAHTGLAASEVYFFGNKVGSTHAKYSLPTTDASDEVLVRQNVGFEVAIDNPYDFNRDGKVNAADQIIARMHPGAIGYLMWLQGNRDLVPAIAAPTAADAAFEMRTTVVPGIATVKREPLADRQIRVPNMVATASPTPTTASLAAFWAHADDWDWALLFEDEWIGRAMRGRAAVD